MKNEINRKRKEKKKKIYSKCDEIRLVRVCAFISIQSLKIPVFSVGYILTVNNTYTHTRIHTLTHTQQPQLSLSH